MGQNQDPGFEEIKVKLPTYLAKWLREFSEAIAMTPDQLLTHVLTYYYETYEIGKRKALEELEEKELIEEAHVGRD